MKKILAVFLIAAFMAPAYGAPVAAVKAPAPKVVKAKAKVKAKIGAAEAMTVAPTPEALKVTFKDLKADNPNYPYVMKMVETYQAISGYPDQTFRGGKTITRAEFSKVMAKSLNYLEEKAGISIAGKPATSEVYFKDLPQKHWAYPTVYELVAKYRIFSGYPDKTFRPNKTINRFELATVLAGALKKVLGAVDQPVPTVSTLEAKQFSDVKPKHWARDDIQLMVKLGILNYKTVTRTEKTKTKQVKRTSAVFEGDKPVDRYLATAAVSKLLDLLVEKAPKKFFGMAAGPLVEKAMVMGRPQAYLTGGWGHIAESASTTGNWLGFSGAAAYGNVFQLWKLQGDYEVSGKYGLNQVAYLTPAGVGGAAGGVVAENRYDLDLNTIYPVINFYGFQGKLLLGAKYANLSNPVAPTSFLAVNAGVATVFPLFDRQLLGRAFYSLIPGTTTRNGSILGQPNLILNYEAGTDLQIMQTPFLAGYMGETMFLNGGTYTRFYNLVFLRYNLL